MKAIGIDIGTTSICVVAWDTDREKVIACLSGENTFLPGTYEQDPERIVDVAGTLLDKILADIGDVDSIGVSSQMHGILYVDQTGKAASPYYTWKNTWGGEAYKGSTYASWLTEETGHPMYTGYGTVTHFYLGQKKQIPNRAKYLTNIGDYLVMKLCGLTEPIMNNTVAASLGGFDLKKLELDLEKLRKAEVDTSFYGKILPKNSRVGNYKGIPVFAAIGDNQASVYASVREKQDRVNINVGTGSQVTVFDNDLLGISKGEIRPYINSGYLYVQTSINGGKVYEKLASFFLEVINAFSVKHSGGSEQDSLAHIYKRMEEIGKIKQTTDMQINPALYGSRTQKGKGSIETLTEENFHLPDFIRAYVEGMAEELYRLYLNFPEQLRFCKKEIVISGNGIRKNSLLQQEIQKKFMLPIICMESGEEAAVGAALHSYVNNI